MRLADEFFLVAHNDVTGRPRLHPRAVGLGLAAALLGELVLAQRVTVHSGVLAVLNRQPPEDGLGHTVLEQLCAENRRHAVRTWLAYLGQDVTEGVAGRLVLAGHLHRTRSRRLGRTAVRYRPVAMNTAAWPAIRLRQLLLRDEALPWPDILLAGLVQATGLAPQVLWDSPPVVHERLARLRAAVPRHFPAVAELLAETQAAVGDAVLAHRR